MGTLWVMFATLCLSGCVKDDSAHAHGPSVSQHADDHEHGRSVRETVWTDVYEVFVDRGVPVLGEPVTFAVHFSEIATGLPAKVGEVTLNLTSPTGKSLSSVRGPARDGIYAPTMSFDESGVWKLVIRASNREAPLEIPWKDVEVYASEEEAHSASLDEGPTGIAFLKEQQWDLEVLTEQVGRKMLSSWKRYPAVVRAKTDSLARVVPSIAGRLLVPVEGRLPRLGERVEAGDVLARIDPPLSGADLMNAHKNYHELETHEAELAVKLAEARAGELRSRASLELAQEALEAQRSMDEDLARFADGRILEQRRLDAKAAIEFAQTPLGKELEALKDDARAEGFEGDITSPADTNVTGRWTTRTSDTGSGREVSYRIYQDQDGLWLEQVHHEVGLTVKGKGLITSGGKIKIWYRTIAGAGGELTLDLPDLIVIHVGVQKLEGNWNSGHGVQGRIVLVRS